MGNPFELSRTAIFGQNCQDLYIQARHLTEEKALSESFALRYHVYCEEQHFLPACDYPLGLETDEHDTRSQHFGVYHQDGLAGTVRLVRPDAAGLFPFHHHCPGLHADARLPPPEHAAEVSRLVMNRSFRRRSDDNLLGVSTAQRQAESDMVQLGAGHQRFCSRPNIVLSLYRAIYQHSKRTGVTHLYASMERSLARLLGRLHLPFVAIGPEFDYYGPVTVYVTKFDEMDARLARCNPMLLEWFQNELPLPGATTSA